jgi:hypothetical protein
VGVTQAEVQLHHARTLIELLHPVPTAATLIEITGLAPKRKPIKRYFFTADVAAEYALEINAERFSAFVSVNPRKAMTGFEHDVPFVSTVGLDLQPERTSIGEVEKRLAAGGIPPTAVGSSGNGAHMYLRLSEPADPTKAKVVWERLCKYTGSDCIFNVNRILRLAGTVNWKTPPSWCYLTSVNPERTYTIDQIDLALDRLGAGPARQPQEGIPVPVDPPVDWLELRQRLPPGVIDIIDSGEKNAYSERQVTRSEADWVVVCALVSAGVPDEMIHWVYETQPVGLMKYRTTGARYLNRTIEAARRATAEQLVNRPVTRMGVAHQRFTGGAGDAQREHRMHKMYR